MSEQAIAMRGDVEVADDAADKAQLTRARAFEKQARGTVQSLSGRFAWPTVVLFLAILAGVSTVAALAIGGHLSYWVAIPVNALLIYAIFAPLHEAVHDNIAGPHRGLLWLERLIGHVSGFVLLAPYPGFRQLHLHHHQHTNDPKEDPDYWVKSDHYLMVVLRCMVIQPVYVVHLYRIARDPQAMRAFWHEVLYIAAYIPIIAGAYALGWGNELMLLWILPGYIGVVMCPLMFDWPVHHPHTERRRYADSAILLFPRPIRKLMEVAFLGHSYHLMHHLYPRLPFYCYGTAYWALEPELTGLGAKLRNFSR